MAWEYLKTKEFDIRYKIAAKHLPKNLSVLDINCGEPHFKNYYQYSRYTANDVFVPDNTEGIRFLQIKDSELDEGAEIICLFGYGGGEHTGEPLESKEAGNTLIRLAQKYTPEYIVIEMAQKWEDDFKIMTTLTGNLKEYERIFEKRIEIEPIDHYHNKRLLTILKR